MFNDVALVLANGVCSKCVASNRLATDSGDAAGRKMQPGIRNSGNQMRPEESVPAAQSVDVATAALMRLRQAGLYGFPRNYEIFYQALTDPQGELAKALSALGARPSQQALDELSRKHIGADRTGTVTESHERIAAKLDEILMLLSKERCTMQSYDAILGETSNGLDNRKEMSREFLDRIVNVMATATKTSIEKRDQLVAAMTEKANELEEVRGKLEEYKRLSETDPLTQLHNRRAFDRTLRQIYQSKRSMAFGALILADLDRFKAVNDQHGHPIGDRILKVVADIITKAAPANAFLARTGGEEFAIILDGVGEEAAYALAERIRIAVSETPFVNLQTGVNYGPLTLSLGTCQSAQAKGPDDLYLKADRALYASKSHGRNKVSRFSALADGNFVKNWLIYSKE